MRPPTQTRLFEVWERGCPESPLRRSLALLAAALPGMDEDALARCTAGRRDAALLALRAAAFGPVIHAVTACRECGTDLESTFSVDDLLRPHALPDAAALHRAEAAGFAVEFRLPSVADLLQVAEGVQRQGLEGARRDLLSRCIAAARRGQEAVPFEALPPETLAVVSAAMAALDPQADLRLEFQCPSCSQRWETPFDIAAFLWTELAAWVRRTAREVHALAAAYGWSEADILGMSAARRRLYLEQVSG